MDMKLSIQVKKKKPLVAYGEKMTKVTQNKIYPVH